MIETAKAPDKASVTQPRYFSDLSREEKSSFLKRMLADLATRANQYREAFAEQEAPVAPKALLTLPLHVLLVLIFMLVGGISYAVAITSGLGDFLSGRVLNNPVLLTIAALGIILLACSFLYNTFRIKDEARMEQQLKKEMFRINDLLNNEIKQSIQGSEEIQAPPIQEAKETGSGTTQRGYAGSSF